MKLPFYRLNTGMSKAQIFDPAACPEYKELLDKRNKLGATATGDPFIPEHFQTEDMLAEALVDETDEFGVYDTSDKEKAKTVLKMCAFQAGVFTADTPDLKAKKLMDLYTKVLDRSSPRDILKDLEAELKSTSSMSNRKSSLAERKEQILKEKELAKSNKVKTI